MIPGDLAPGDAKSLQGDWSKLNFHRITSIQDPFFKTAFNALWTEFGSVGEIERPEIISRRMLWNPSEMREGRALQYCMILATAEGKLAAVRDHTAILLANAPGAIVHMSHNLVAPEWRRSGLAGWFRSYPITTAREVLALHGRSHNAPITLVGEMETYDAAYPARVVRLAAYEKAGYKKVDPSRVHYLQPDFRAPQNIDQNGGVHPIPLCLIIRRVGREEENFITGAEVRQIVCSLYKMYGSEFRARDMAAVYQSLETYPPDEEQIPLLPPTAV